MRRLRAYALGAAAGMAVAAAGFTASPASAAQLCEQYASTTVGQYIVQNNVWNPAASPQCIETSGNGFRITSANHNVATNGAPASYPSIYYGCHYKNCSPGTILPIQSTDPRHAKLTSSVSMSYPSSGSYDASYDIWYDPQPNTSTQNTGVEIMIWLNRQGSIQPIGSKTGTANLYGTTWDVWQGPASGWNVISFVRQSPGTSLNFSVQTFFDEAVKRGSAQNGWYLTSLQAGFEPWIGGTGLAVTDFSVSTDGQPPTSGPDNTTTTKTSGGGNGGSGRCQVDYRLDSSSATGFIGKISVTNTKATAVDPWKVTFKVGRKVVVKRALRAKVSQSGTTVTLSPKGQRTKLAPGASLDLGIVATGPSSPSPKGFRLNGAVCR